MAEEYLKFLQQKPRDGIRPADVTNLGPDHAHLVRSFHETLPGYAPTPLLELKDLAKIWHVGAIYVKDESFRFGLNAFKALGSSYAAGRYIADMAGLSRPLDFTALTDQKVREMITGLVLATATDGNHGRGVAWVSQLLGCKSVVYLPKGSSPERVSGIRSFGAKTVVTDLNYDDTVRFAREQADKNGWILIQDTTLDGYEEIPQLIMEGYTTMADEIIQQLKGKRPTHIFLQAGVGSFAGAMAGYFSNLYPDDEKPVITVIEPSRADCLFRTACAADGALHTVAGTLDTMMAGLACGTPCSLGWKVLASYADFFMAVPDYIAAQGMRILGSPAGSDPRIISGESGAAAFGLLSELLTNRNLMPLLKDLRITKDSRILCISTEGDTDKQSYRHIVWDGHYPHPIPPVRKKSTQ